jgi:4-aminobutyrate aminotransferase-like enzyme
LAVLQELESRDLVNEADRKGKLFRAELEKIQQRFPNNISWILGEGMIMAMLFQDPVTGEPDSQFTSQVAERCMQKGLLVVHTGRESMKFGPPLTISDDALLEGVAVLCETIEELNAE